MATNYDVAHREGKVAKAIESQTAKLPSDVFLWAGLGLLAVGGIMQLTKVKNVGNYLSQWAAPILITGLYNKLVKLEGYDGVSSGS
jgi:hypothetical protein